MGVLDDKVVVVTGGASGIGGATVRRCLNEGARVVAADIQDAAAINDATDRTRLLVQRCDVSAAAEVDQLMRRTVAHFGRLDVLVCAAGISGGTAETTDYAEADFDRVIAIDLKGVFLCMRAAIPHMLRGGGGAVVNIASVMGLVALPRTPAYSAAKAGVIQLTKVAALEYAGRNVRVNCICPGMIDTPMVQSIAPAAQQHFLSRQALNRHGTADEVATTAVFLASDASSFTTGAAWVVDGGYTAQ